MLVLILSIPFWILGAITEDLTKVLPVKLPISALMAFSPLMAAVILVYRESKKEGVKKLLFQVFDFKKIHKKKWYIPIVLFMPGIMLLSLLYIKTTGVPLPAYQIPFSTTILFSIVYFIGAIGEEVGWTGYVTEPLQNKHGALQASIIIGVFWAVWHIIPFMQAHQTTNWIIWQCIAIILLRTIMVWIFNNTGKSVFAIILFHTMINVSMFSFPNFGSHYDPFVATLFLLVTVFMIIFFCGTSLVRPARNETTNSGN